MFTGAGREVAWGLLGGTVLDCVIPDPRTGHPVAAFGRAAGLVERRTWTDSRARGVAFTIVCAGVWVLRVRHPDLHRPFKTPFVPLVPILGIFSCLVLMFSLLSTPYIS